MMMSNWKIKNILRGCYSTFCMSRKTFKLNLRIKSDKKDFLINLKKKKKRMFILTFFAVFVFCDYPKFDTINPNDSDMFHWFDFLLDLRDAIFSRFKGLQISPNELDLGPVIRGIIDNLNITYTINYLFNNTFNSFFGTNFELNKQVTQKFTNSTGDMAINQSLIPQVAHYFVWEPITGYTLTQDEWTEIIQEWNGLISSASILILIFAICILLFIFQLVFCRCCCKPMKSVPMAGGCLMFFAVLTLIFSIISLVFFIIGCIRLTIFRKKIYDVPNYLPEITVPITDSLQRMALNFSQTIGTTFDENIAEIQKIYDTFNPNIQNIKSSVSSLQEKVDDNQLDNLITELNSNMQNLKTELQKNTETENYVSYFPDSITVDQARSEMKNPFTYILNYADDAKGVTSFADTVMDLMRSSKKVANLSLINFGQHTAEYYVQLSQTDQYEDTGAINTLLSSEVFGVFSIMFDNYIILQVIVILIAVLMIALLFFFFLSMLCNNKCTRCFTQTSSVLPFVISLVIFFIGAIITFVGATLSSLTHTYNGMISQGINEAITVFGLNNMDLQTVSLSHLTNGYITNKLTFSDIMFNMYEDGDISTFLNSPYGTGLYTALSFGTKLSPPDFYNNLYTTIHSITTPLFSQEIQDNLAQIESQFVPLITSDFQFLFDSPISNVLQQITNAAESLPSPNRNSLIQAVQAFQTSFENNQYYQDYSNLNTIYNYISGNISSTFSVGGLAAAETFRTLGRGIVNAIDLFDIKPIAGLLIFVWNEFILYFGEALAYVSIGAHLYMIGSILMVCALMRRRKYMLSQNEQVQMQQNINTKKRKYRHHTDLVDDQDNLLLDFNLRYNTSHEQISSSDGNLDNFWAHESYSDTTETSDSD